MTINSHLLGIHQERNAGYEYRTPAVPTLYDAPQEVIERQNVYYLASEDGPQDQHLHVAYVPGPTLRDNNIVFVKAPQLLAPLPNIVVPTPQNEQKTLVYVLQKTPEQPADVRLQPHHLQTATHKPEVLFVKYDNDHDAHAKIVTGLQGGAVKNLYGVQDVGNQEALLNAIKNNNFKSQIHIQHEHHEYPVTVPTAAKTPAPTPAVLYGAVPPTY